ncbi:cysteine-rich secretory protein 1-like [Sigmodon hispidus]
MMDMTLFPLLLILATILPPSILQEDHEVKHFKDLSTTKKSVQEEIVNKHNQLRQAVIPSGSDLLKMQWNYDAQANAERWASQCNYKHSSQEIRNIGIKCGENLFMSNFLASWSYIIQDWYDESKNFNFGKGPKKPNKQVGHYTQLVWNTSHQLGCAIAECPEEELKYFYVCHYCPPGNYIRRQYVPYTRGEPCALCPDDCEDNLCTNRCNHEDKYSNCLNLKKSLTCKHPTVKKDCKATCNCQGKIH